MIFQFGKVRGPYEEMKPVEPEKTVGLIQPMQFGPAP